MSAIGDIVAERKRQMEAEGWSETHDDDHVQGQLADAARCYLAGNSIGWPWHKRWWKPTTHRRNLVKAAALIAAEIDRLDRSSR